MVGVYGQPHHKDECHEVERCTIGSIQQLVVLDLQLGLVRLAVRQFRYVEGVIQGLVGAR